VQSFNFGNASDDDLSSTERRNPTDPHSIHFTEAKESGGGGGGGGGAGAGAGTGHAPAGRKPF